MKNVRKELIRLYEEFVAFIVESNKNYDDTDFSFSNFMDYLNMQEEDEIRKVM